MLSIVLQDGDGEVTSKEIKQLVKYLGGNTSSGNFKVNSRSILIFLKPKKYSVDLNYQC